MANVSIKCRLNLICAHVCEAVLKCWLIPVQRKTIGFEMSLTVLRAPISTAPDDEENDSRNPPCEEHVSDGSAACWKGVQSLPPFNQEEGFAPHLTCRGRMNGLNSSQGGTQELPSSSSGAYGCAKQC